MKEVIVLLEKELNEVNSLLQKSNKASAKAKNLADIKVGTSISNGHSQFYYIEKGQPKKYIKKADIGLYTKYIQKDYDIQTNGALKEIGSKIERIIDNYKKYNLDTLKAIYSNESSEKKSYITPLIAPDESLIEEWKEAHPANQNPFPEDGNVVTKRGEIVRSKSEKIIADLFTQYAVPYSYEPCIMFENGRCVYPDFAIFNVRLKKTIYWEHLGLIDSGDYAIKNLKKINDYEKNGIEIGDNLIITTESSLTPLDSRIAERKIQKYCL